MRTTSNPAFRNLPRGFGNYAGFDTATKTNYAASRPMTIDDVVTKTAITLVVALATGALSVYFQVPWPVALGAFVVGFVLSLVIIFKRTPNPALVLAYSAAEGVVLGAITKLFNDIYPGIAFQAIAGTFGVFAAMLVVYKTGAVRVTPRLTKWIIGATVGVLIVLLANLVVSMFGVNLGLRDGSPLAIVFSIIVIGIAAFNLLLDFDQADRMIRAGLPARWSWYAAFGLMVTLVWLYLEILRLLSYLNRR